MRSRHIAVLILLSTLTLGASHKKPYVSHSPESMAAMDDRVLTRRPTKICNPAFPETMKKCSPEPGIFRGFWENEKEMKAYFSMNPNNKGCR